jgi:hypothetical protein
MRRHLAMPGETVEATIGRLEEDFSLVGVVEFYPQFVQRCSELVGEQVPHVRERVTQRTADNDIDVTEAQRMKIRQLNQLDQQLWQHFRDRIQ